MQAQTVDTPVRPAAHSGRMAAAPHIMLIGYGITDSLQLTVEAQRALSRFGSAYTIGLPPVLGAFLKAQRVKVTDLAPELRPDAPAEGYLAVASRILERTATDRPVMLLVPGHPLIFNSIGRYLAAEGKRLGLSVQAIAGVSQLDMLIGGIGLDVSTFGVQVFDAARFVQRSLPLSPRVPLILTHAGAIGPNGGVTLDELAARLRPCYPADHAVVIIELGPAGMTAQTTAVHRLAALTGGLTSGSHLFVDAVRSHTGNPA